MIEFYITDKELALRDKGLIILLLELQKQDIKITLDNLREYTSTGKEGLKSTIYHLMECGYLRRIDNRQAGRKHYIYEIEKYPKFLQN